MSTAATVPIPSGATIGDTSPVSSPSAVTGSTQQMIPIPDDATIGGQSPSSFAGEATNDVGNTVIIPKDGESFQDTMKRAANQGRQTTQPQIDAEMATVPRKATEVLGAAPLIGAGGAAVLAGPNEIAAATKAAVTNLTPALTKGVLGISAWAADHPMTAKAIWEGLKLAYYGKVLHAAGKVIDSAPDR